MPQIVTANVAYPVDKEGKIIGTDLQQLQQAMNEYGAKPYTIIERKGYKIGVFGLIGHVAASNAPKAGVTFDDPVKKFLGLVCFTFFHQNFSMNEKGCRNII